jgi:hypothetical protein
MQTSSCTSTAQAAENEIEINAQKHTEGCRTSYRRKSNSCRTPDRSTSHDISAVLIEPLATPLSPVPRAQSHQNQGRSPHFPRPNTGTRLGSACCGHEPSQTSRGRHTGLAGPSQTKPNQRAFRRAACARVNPSHSKAAHLIRRGAQQRQAAPIDCNPRPRCHFGSSFDPSTPSYLLRPLPPRRPRHPPATP